MPFKLLVVANRTCPCPELHEQIGALVGDHGGGEVLVVAPALNSRAAHWVSDTDGAVAAARDRLDLAVRRLRERGLEVRGEVGDAEPFNAIQDALAGFAADEVVISTHPEGQSHWLEKGLLERAQTELKIPVRHAVTSYDAPMPPDREATAATM